MKKYFLGFAFALLMMFAPNTASAQTFEVGTFEELLNTIEEINANAEGEHLISLTNDITLTNSAPYSSADLEFKKSVVTIQGNGHSIISNFTGTHNIVVRSGATLNLGLKDDSGNLLTITGGENQSHDISLISIMGGTVNMYPGVSLRDYINKSTNDITTGGGAVSIRAGTFNMFGGMISNCQILNNDYYNHGAGVLVRDTGEFNMYGGSISENTQNSYGYGGGVAVIGAEFNMYGGEIFNNSAPKFSSYYQQSLGSGGGSGGGVAISDDAYFNMTGGRIYGNTANYAGGGVYAAGDSTFIIKGEEGKEIEFYDNSSMYGGAVYVNGKNFEITNAKVYGNTSTYDGAALYINTQNEVNMTNVTIYKNEAGYDGGAVYVKNTVVNMINGIIFDNEADYAGGVLVRANSGFNLISGAIYNNKALEYGGAVLLYGGSFNMNSGEIYGNSALIGGGAVFVNSGATFNMASGKIYNNEAEKIGGAVFLNGGIFNMTGGELYDNKSASYGGGVYVAEASGSLKKTGGAIYNNTANLLGDDIFAENSYGLELDAVGEGLLLGSTNQPITDWYYDGPRFTGEFDENDEEIYDETRWNPSISNEDRYIYVYTKPTSNVSVGLKAAHGALKSYTIVHEYYTNGAKDGEVKITDKIGEIDSVISANNIDKLVSYDNNKYIYTPADTDYILLSEDGENIIILRYDRIIEDNSAESGNNSTESGNNSTESGNNSAESGNNSNNESTSSNNTNNNMIENPKTGDDFNLMLTVMTMLCSLFGLIFLTKKGKELL